MKEQKRLLVVLTGAYGNLGDAVIRRRIFQWVRDSGEVHAYVGNATADWIDELGMADKDTLYRSSHVKAWLKLFFARRAPLGLIFDPGEIPLGRNELRPELMFLVLTIVTRLRGGVVVRPPRGIGDFNWVTGQVHRMSVRFSNVTLWRNSRSLELMKLGDASPDTAFQEDASTSPTLRNSLIVSMRGKRSTPSENWFDAVRSLAKAKGLAIVVLSQVREDEERTKELAEVLGGTHFAWGERSDLNHELAVRKQYESAKFVVSDRLHVVILSALAGAVPLEAADSPRGKIAEHFAQIGVSGVSFDTSARSAVDLIAFAEAADQHYAQAQAKMETARSQLHSIESRVRALLNAAK